MSLADRTPGAPRGPAPTATFTGTTGEVQTGLLDAKIGDDWGPILRLFGVENPDDWEVVDDTVKCSVWQQSARTADGDRDVVNLYSYRASFRRKSAEQLLSDADLASSRARLRRFRHRAPRPRSGPPVTYVHHQGDEQAGKGEGGELAGLLDRESEVVARSLDRLDALIRRGVNVEAIVDNSAGDRVENVFGHYPSQARTTATLRRQFDFAVSMDVERTRAFAAFGVPIHKVYTPSNHGEIRQGIGLSPFTSASDNYDLIIAELVKRILDETAIADQLVWHIPHDEWLTVLEVSGVPIGATHGHKADKRNLKSWVKEQRDYWHFHHGHRMQVLLMGHRHHAYLEDISGTTVIQTPSLDGGSPYFEARYGERSGHGALSLLVGDGLRMGWDELAVL